MGEWESERAARAAIGVSVFCMCAVAITIPTLYYQLDSAQQRLAVRLANINVNIYFFKEKRLA